MKLRDLTPEEIEHVSLFIRNITEFTLEQTDDNERNYYLLDHPDTSDDTYNVSTVADLIEFAYVQGFARGEEKARKEMRKALGVKG